MASASTSAKLQIISNTFVHLRDKPLRLTPIGDELALLGNIGALGNKKTAEFLRHCADNFRRIYWVPGPLEWRTRQAKSFGQKEELINICSPFVNILPMIQTKIVTPQGLHILGTTLWSPVPDPGCPNAPHFYQEDSAWLTSSLLFAPAAIVLTHHLPYRLEHLLAKPTLGAWLAGSEPVNSGKLRSSPLEPPPLA